MTPLQLALDRQNSIAARWLIEVGASTRDPDLLLRALVSANPELVHLVLSSNTRPVIPPNALIHAVSNNQLEIIRLLVAAGADPDSTEPGLGASALQVASQMDDASEVLRLLLDLGGKPSPAWMAKDFEGAIGSHRLLLYRRFMISHLLGRPAVTLILPEWAPIPPVALATDQGEPPLPLSLLLLNQRMNWPRVRAAQLTPSLLTVTRKTEGGVETFSVRLERDEALPELRWGDVVELAPDWEAVGGRKDFNLEYADEMPPGLRWELLRRVTFPITVEIDGKERPLTVAGNRLIFDPGADQVPFIGAAGLARLMCRPQFMPDGSPEVSLSIIRAGWPLIEVPANRDSAHDVPLRAGDRVVIRTPSPANDPEERKRSIAIHAAGIPFCQILAGNDRPSGSGVTLMQALAETTGWWAGMVDPSTDSPQDLLGQDRDGPDRVVPLRLLPHPDYSKIVIRRLGDEGKEQRLTVDLAAAITAGGAEVSAETARAADVPLLPGDIVEIPQRAEMAGKPWPGPSAEEIRFFTQALDCRVHVIGRNGVMESRKIHYASPQFVEIAGQWIPTRPREGAASLSAAVVLGLQRGDVTITRQGSESKQTGSAARQFLREGDLVVTDAPDPTSGAEVGQPGPRQPRPRMVPPPQPSPGS